MRKVLWVAIVTAACGGTPKSEPAIPAVASPPPMVVPAKTPIATQPLTSRAPVARKDGTVDTFFGEQVADPYRWLEGDSADVKTWLEGQNAYTASLLEALPTVDALREDISKIARAPQTKWTQVRPTKTLVFAQRQLPDEDAPSVVALADVHKPESAIVIFKPDAAKHESVDFFTPSAKGDKIAISISVNGSEVGDLHIFDAKGKEIDSPIISVERPTSGGDVAWLPDGSGLYYTHYPVHGEEHDQDPGSWQQLWRHTIGSTSNTRVLVTEIGTSEQITSDVDAKGNVLVSVQHGDSGPVRHYVNAGGKGPFKLVADSNDNVALAVLGSQNDLWLVSRKDAPMGRVLHLPIGQPLAKATLVVPASNESIETEFYTSDGLTEINGAVYVLYEAGGPEKIRGFSRAGKALPALSLPDVASVVLPRAWRGGLITGAATFTQPFTYYLVSARGAAEALPISAKATIDMSPYEVLRETATSKDGTKVPYTLLRKKGAPQDGRAPCLVNGYGGFDISMTPYFLEGFTPLLSRGVCYVISNLRGGSEFGEAWHQAGTLTRKQNVFDDYAAVLADVVAKKYTSVERLAATGASNGGLLMGAMLTQHPELVKAVVAYVGIYDSLRYELTPNGATNTNEYGTVKDPAQFRALRAYSPLHNVTTKALPATLLVAGDNDGRVAPYNSRKFAAALQAAQTGTAPILLKTSSTSGHGFGTGRSERIEEEALVDAFLLWQLGVTTAAP